MVEDSDDDECFFFFIKVSLFEDLLDKNFVKWIIVGRNMLKSNRDKDSIIKFELLSSDVEFSVCLLVISCIEDSGISLMVRDDDFEEIFFNSLRFSLELYK